MQFGEATPGPPPPLPPATPMKFSLTQKTCVVHHKHYYNIMHLHPLLFRVIKGFRLVFPMIYMPSRVYRQCPGVNGVHMLLNRNGSSVLLFRHRWCVDKLLTWRVCDV